MEKEKNLPGRKPTRLKAFDYSREGAYFVTVCTKEMTEILSEVIETGKNKHSTCEETTQIPVGVGALDDPFVPCAENYTVSLTDIGKTVEKYLLSSNNISGVRIDSYVIMPNHIHAIIFFDEEKYID